MKIGVIGDDLTGSGDIANTLAKAGAVTIQHVGIPGGPPSREVDAVVISLKTRSVPASEAIDKSLEACRWLVANGARQIVFKYCSTFDSTPAGNIGPVAEALANELAAPLALVCPAFPANGRTVFQGHLFVYDKLLNESGMENHPLTPMTDPDIRRWLGLQTGQVVGHLRLADLRADGEGAMRALEQSGARLVVADAIEDADLAAVARLARTHRLVTGGSGIAMGLPANFGILPRQGERPGLPDVSGPAVVLSGSCSKATRAQIEVYRMSHPALKVGAHDVLEDRSILERARAFMTENMHSAPLVYSSDEPASVTEAQLQFGTQRLAEAFETFFANLAESAIDLGFRRIVTAGGETSGAVAAALPKAALEIGPEIAPGVPALFTDGRPRLALALKSGNFGGEDFFERAVKALKGSA